jgi:hypothetical protein
MRQLALHVEARQSDPHHAAELTWDLREELERSQAESIEHAAGTAPDGAKGSAHEWAQLLVTFSGGLPGLIALVRGWADRNDRDAAVTLELDGDRIELSDASPEERKALLDAFLARHA